jgi:hypothetical protein
MRTRFAGRNGALVLVGAMGLVGERLVSRGVAVGAGRGVEMREVGAGLKVGMGEGVVLCTTGGVCIVFLARLQARPVKMAPKRKATSRMRVFFIYASLYIP